MENVEKACRRHWRTHYRYRNMSLWRRLVPPLALILCIAFQTIESSALWNTSMLNLQDTLEGMEVTTEEAMAVQGWTPLFRGLDQGQGGPSG